MFELQSLGDYCQRSDIEAPQRVLEERLFELMRKRWWLRNVPDDIQLQAEYDNLLPVNLIIKPLPSLPVGGKYKIGSNGQPSPAVVIGDSVQLQNFVVTEVEVDEQQLTLNLPRAVEERPQASYRLRLTGVSNIEQYQEGQTVNSLYGVVINTRQEMLTRLANQAMYDQAVDVSGNRLRLPPDITTSLPAELPNPLATYHNILLKFAQIKISTIHGDLNLENVLIDPITHDVHLIDFAAARKGHALHDLLHLEQGVTTQLIPTVLVEAQLPTQTIWTIYQQLHQVVVHGATPSLPHFAIEKPFNLLVAIRNAARDCLFNSKDWIEYYQGLIIYLLGALKFKDLDEMSEAPQPKQVAFWGAAAIQALIDNPPPPLAAKQRVQIYVQGEYASLSAERVAAIVDALAGLMSVSAQQIEVYRVSAGSIILDLGLPEEAVQLLRSLLQSNSAQLSLLRIEKVVFVFEGKSEKDEVWTSEGGKYNSAETQKSDTERKTIMSDHEKSSSGVSIGDVKGGIHGSVIAGGDVTNVNAHIGRKTFPDDEELTVAEFRQLLSEIQQALTEVTTQKKALDQISDDASFYMDVVASSVQKVAEKIKNGEVLESEEAKSVEKSLEKAGKTLSSILDEAKEVGHKTGEVGKAIKPITMMLEPVIEKLGRAAVWVAKLWLAG